MGGDRDRAARLPDRAEVRWLNDGFDPWEASALRALVVAVGVIALIACLNLSALMTARCLDRARDIGLRRAIGARTRDVVGLLLAEHFILFVAGATMGIAAAVPLLRVVVALLPPTLQLLKVPAFDLRVTAFVAISVLTSLLISSIWPIRRALRSDVQRAIASAGGTAVTPRLSSWGMRLAISGQVAGTIALVIAGGLLVASLVEVRSNETGYRVDDLVVAELALTPWMDGAKAANRRPDIQIRLNQLLEDLRRLPTVAAAGAADVSVLTSSVSYASRFDPVNPTVPRDASHSPGTFVVGESGGLKIPVTAGFFRAAGITAVDGRLPTDNELQSGAAVVAISRSYARAHFPGRSPIGERLRHTPADKLPTFEVVGIVDDPRLMRWDGPMSAAVYAPYATFGGNPDPVMFVHATDIAAVMGDVVRRSEAQQPLMRPVRVETASVLLADTIRDRRLQSWLFGSFAVAGLVLGGAGLLGLAAMTMARRTREMGIRLALGATRRRLVSGLVGEHALPVLIGLVAGATLAAWGVRFLESYVYRLSLYDLRIWLASVVLVAATALIGALVPALRGGRVDPVRALRVE